MEWLVQLTGENYDLEELSKSIKRPELTIDKEEDKYILKSSDFNGLGNVDEVRQKATDIISLISGCASLTQGMRKPLEIAHITLVKDNGTRTSFINLTATMNVRASVGIVKVEKGGMVQEIRPSDVILDWFHIAQGNENVAKVLYLLGMIKRDWVTLYKIYEMIEDDIGSVEDIQKNGWATKKAVRRFKHTANSPGIIGDNSRHGVEKTTPPRDPMSFSEAKSLIEGIAQNWIRSKA